MLEPPRGEAVLTCTRNQCFGSKIKKLGIYLQTPVYYIKVGYNGVYISRTCFPDVYMSFNNTFNLYFQKLLVNDTEFFLGKLAFLCMLLHKNMITSLSN